MTSRQQTLQVLIFSILSLLSLVLLNGYLRSDSSATSSMAVTTTASSLLRTGTPKTGLTRAFTSSHTQPQLSGLNRSVKRISSTSLLPPQASSSSTMKRSFHSTSRSFQKNATSAIPHISLHIAAASSGKQRKYEPEKSTVDFIPSDDKALGLQGSGNVYSRRRARPDSGEDSYFVSRVGKGSDTYAFGVCDGVGGWQEHGIDPADFSHGLSDYMAQKSLSWADTPDKLAPRALMQYAYDQTLNDHSIRAGGSTASVAIADNTGRMRTANLGDSGFVQLRLGTVLNYSNPQTHAFNTPFQMSKTPPEIMTQAAIFGGLPLNDSPDRADLGEYHLQHGDIVIFATDGVWDNLSPQDILTTVSQLMRDSSAWEKSEDKGFLVTDQLATMMHTRTIDGQKKWSLPSLLASSIVGEAKAASRNAKRDGPFAKAVQKEYPFDRYHGGKVDDITVVVLIAVQTEKDLGQLKAKL